MSRIDKYLDELYNMPKGYEPVRDDIMECKICGRKADVLNEGRGTIVCCGQPMVKIGEAIDRHPKGDISVAEAEGMKGLPKGWTQKSLRKFSKSLTGREGTKEKFFEKCVAKMRGKVDNPEAFCASVKDELHGSTYWRGKGKSPQEAGKDVKAHQNVKQERKALIESFLKILYTDMRPPAKEWQGPNIPYGDDSDRPNLVRKCMSLEGHRMKINCLRKLQDMASMNPQYRVKIDRWVDAITQTYEPTDKPGTIPGNEFESGK